MKMFPQEKKGCGFNLVEKIQRVENKERGIHTEDINQSAYIFELYAPN